MRVLLVQSPSGRGEPPVFPLGLAFLAGQLGGHEISALDMSVDPSDHLREAVTGSSPPDVVAVSLRNIDDSGYPDTWSYLRPFESMLGILEGWDGTLLAGGPGFTINAPEIMRRYGRIDAGVAGEGEEILPGLLNDPSGLRRSRALHRAAPVDLAAIRPPDYSILPLGPYDRHFGIGVQSRRGCAFGCTYCTYAFLGGRAFRCRSAASVASDIRSIRSLGGTRFMFVDSVFDAPASFFRELVGLHPDISGGLEWGAWIDAGIPGEDIDAMAAAGCRKVDFSPDAITSAGMRRLGKTGDFRSIVRSVRRARSAGMDVGVNFFSRNPGEGFAALLAKFAFMVSARLLLGYRHTTVHIGTIRVYRGSRIAEEMKADGRVPGDCDFLDPVFLPAGGASGLLLGAFQALRRTRHV